MSTLTVTTKGQITLRRDLLAHLGVQPGEKIAVDKLPDGRLEMKAVQPAGKISDVFDFLKRKNGPSLSVEESNEVAKRGWAGKGDFTDGVIAYEGSWLGAETLVSFDKKAVKLMKARGESARLLS